MDGLNELRPSALKWAGGKLKVMDNIIPHLKGHTKLVEPFMGSGAVFNNTLDVLKSGVLSDTNRDLILFHSFLREHKERFIKDCEALFIPENNVEDKYYELRLEFNTTVDDYRKATLFAYLNRHCFNGLCRYNKLGKFNVSFGDYRKPVLQTVAMKMWCERLQQASVINMGFEKAFELSGSDSVIYCDPPYVPVSATSNFTSYTQDGFSNEDQIRLRDLALDVPNKVIISNHDTPVTRELYKDFKIVSFPVQRNISCKGDSRMKVNELLAIKEQKNN